MLDFDNHTFQCRVLVALKENMYMEYLYAAYGITLFNEVVDSVDRHCLI